MKSCSPISAGWLSPRSLLPLLLALSAGCQCGIKPVPDQASSTFQMSRDSLAFPNFVTGYDDSVVDAESLQRMFGPGVCAQPSSPCQLSSGAKSFLKQANASMAGGRCEGFAVLSDLMEAKKVDPEKFGGSSGRELTLEDNPALQKEIAYWFATQLVPGAVASKTKAYSAREVLPVLADSFEPDATEHFRIGIVRKDGKSLTGGHALTPIGFYRDPAEPAVYWLRVYDNNFPDVERLMKLDTKNDRWEFEASTNPAKKSRLYYGDKTNNNKLFLAPIFSRQGTLPCPFCKGGGAQVSTSGGTQASVTTPGGTTGVTEGDLTAAPGTSITPTFSNENDAEPASFIIGLDESVVGGMGGTIVVNVTMQPDQQNPEALQGLSVQKDDVFTMVERLHVTASDAFTASAQGGTYTNNSRTPLELTTRLPTTMGEVSVTAIVNGGSDEVRATVDPATGKLTVDLAGSMGVSVTVIVEGTTPDGMTRSAQFTFTAMGTVTLQADTTMWMQGNPIGGTLNNGGMMTSITNACTDGVRNGMETDVDCGASCGVGCLLGRACAVDADCNSGLCHPTQRVCIADACQDTRLSPGESDVDCGGPCAPCAVGLACRVSADCAQPLLNDCVASTCQRVFTVGAEVTMAPGVGGAGAELILDNGGARLSISGSGTYAFAQRTPGPYAVTIVQQPARGECTVMSPSGTATADVTVTVSCARRFTLGGLVNGLPAGESVTIRNNGLSPLTLMADGSFEFPLQPPGPYQVSIATQPMTATCRVINGTGPDPSADVTNIEVQCSTAPAYTIGGTLSGLAAGQSLVLDNLGDPLMVSMNGAFTFMNPVLGAYDVVVAVPPMSQTCTVMNGVGTATANVTTITVTCSSAFTIGGTVTGLNMGQTVVLDQDGDTLPVMANGPFTFMMPVASAYTVNVVVQPMGQECTVTNGSGMASANVTNVTVTCVDLFTVGGTLTGLGAMATLVLENNGEQLPLMADGPFTFTSGTSGPYSVTIFAQPAGQTCSVQNGSGTATANVTSVTVTCLGASGRDTTFGAGGFLRVTQSSDFDLWHGLVVNPDNSSVLAGTVDLSPGLSQWVVSKVTAAGAIDTTFGTNGHTFVTAGTGPDDAKAIVRDAMGRYLVAGSIQGMTNADLGVARLTAGGALDPTFGTNGVARFDLGGADVIEALTLDTMGRPVVVGARDGSDIVVVRLTAAGALDATFATGGIFVQAGAMLNALRGVVTDASNNVIAVGYRANDSMVVKLTSAGALDMTFGTMGVATVDLTTGLYADHLEAVALDGTRIVAAGGGLDSGASNFYLAAFTATGALDTAFGSAGVTAIGTFAANEQFHALTPRPGGGWYAAGSSDQSAAVLAFTATGSLDMGFGTSGQFIDAYSGEAIAFAVRTDSLGRIVIAGAMAVAMGNPDLGIARINP